ncbi:hypothetical protein D9619_001833 [Psilocybe cf. subviscida]|uniref:NACHT domain-containing protein n=1 Tax=Psilocybe cf. subviscida TaxID=2480587 RepID=A0A8H5BEJ9_9AGAR|nr:hypothetical protein D9619_001833 [Psilocybe cf. subviscida]
MDQSSNLKDDTQIPNDTGYQPAASSIGQASVFANANDVRIRDSNFSITTNVNTATKSILDVLYQRVAPNAVLNDGGRADDAKCHPGTREEVIGLIEEWMDATKSDRILWLSGPAGGGKTAIMKTITERAASRGVKTVNFFFFRGDSTRNSIQPVVPTLLYQLFEFYPTFGSQAVAEILSTRPRIFDGSIAQQCKLISELTPIIRQSSPAGTPIVLLIDGLDECDVYAEQSQGDILRALEGLLKDNDSPFRLLIASRPEARIKMTFNQLSSHAQTIFLDEQYSPEDDIRRFVTAEFDRIKLSHPSARSLPHDWPLFSDAEGIVRKSSGQFIFAATVMRYIAHASTVPSLSLERVKGIVPSGKNSPFAHLDSIYTFILSQVDDLDATLIMFFLSIAEPGYPLKCLSDYNPHYTDALVESCASELSAIVQLTYGGVLKFYHASLPDFLVDQEDLLSHLKAPTVPITEALLNLPFPDWPIRYQTAPYPDTRGEVFFRAVHKLYYSNDEGTYKHILDRAISICLARKILPNVQEIPYGKQYLNFYETRLRGLGKLERAQWASIVDNRSRAENIDTASPKSSKAYNIGSPLIPISPASTSTPYIPHMCWKTNRLIMSPPNSQVSMDLDAPHASLPNPPSTLPHPTPDPPTRRKYSEAVVSCSTGTPSVGGVTTATGSSSNTVTRPTGRNLGNVAPTKAISNAEKRTTSSGRSSLAASTSTSKGVRGESQRNSEREDGEKKGNGDTDKDHAVSAAVGKGSATASFAPRLTSEIQSRAPTPRRSPAVNAREKDSTRPGTRPMWRG